MTIRLGLVDSRLPSGPEMEGPVTSQGTAHGRFTRAIQQPNLFRAELALREMRTPSLLAALDYLESFRGVTPNP